MFQECCVLGLSSIGQVCGRVSLVPYLEEKDEVLIRPIWLPNSYRYLALLTTQSVQVDSLGSIFFSFLAFFKEF